MSYKLGRRKFQPQSSLAVPPPAHWKINFDVAIRHSFALAVCVCRDSEGHVLFVRTKRLPPCSPLMGEAWAALYVAQEAFLLPTQGIILEGDSLLVIEAIQNPSSAMP